MLDNVLRLDGQISTMMVLWRFLLAAMTRLMKWVTLLSMNKTGITLRIHGRKLYWQLILLPIVIYLEAQWFQVKDKKNLYYFACEEIY